MAEASQAPRRLVICVDGTWCHPDGAGMSGAEAKNITNVYRLFASVHEGDFIDEQGKRYAHNFMSLSFSTCLIV